MKKFFAVFLMLMLCTMTLFAGCGKSKTDTKTKEPMKTEATKDSAATEKAADTLIPVTLNEVAR